MCRRAHRAASGHTENRRPMITRVVANRVDLGCCDKLPGRRYSWARRGKTRRMENDLSPRVARLERPQQRPKEWSECGRALPPRTGGTRHPGRNAVADTIAWPRLRP